MLENKKIDNLLNQAIETAIEIRKQVNNLDHIQRRKRTTSDVFAEQYEIDVLADQIVHDHMGDFEGYILSEEREVSKHELEANELVLVIDPIDGSKNAARSIGYWCFAAALMYRGEVVGAVVVDQVSHKIYKATKDTPATLINHQGEQRELYRNEDICEDVGNRADNFSSSIICFSTHEGPTLPFRHLRHYGASALSICEVAAGAINAYVDDEDILLKPWDLLAAEYIAKKSGCSVIRRDSEGLFAATGVLVTQSNTLLEAFEDIFPNFFNN